MTVKNTKDIQNDRSKCRREVYAAIKTLGVCCDVDIAQYLSWPINRVTGRRWELENLEFVESIGKKPSLHSGIAVFYWKIKKKK